MWLIADELPSWLLAGGSVMLLSITATVTGIFVRGTLQTGARADRLHDAAARIQQNQIDDLRREADAADERLEECEGRWEQERAERLDERARYERLLEEQSRRHSAELERLRSERPPTEPPETS